VIIITGTKRSGTSMWMRVLEAAGLPIIGHAFPGIWGETIRDANPGGFFESLLRRGVYFATNPHPKTGDYLFPDDTRRHAVKIFVPGLIRSDMAFIDRVIATMRPWREYVTSLERLYTMEDEAREQRETDPLPPPVRMPPALEWWVENFSLVSDALTRRYPMHMVAYESVLADPARLIPEALEWLGEGNVAQAVAVVDPQARTQQLAEDAHPDPHVGADEARVFDAFYARVRDREPLTGDFIDELNATNERLAERIAGALVKVREGAERRRQLRIARAKERGEAEEPTRDAVLEEHDDLLGEGL
jgi:truncated hemoglobin YjbI